MSSSVLRSDKFCGQVTGQVTMSTIAVIYPENRVSAEHSGEAGLFPV
jgi:hypothetical protein